MKKFLRLFALCTMFMVSAFTHPALADVEFNICLLDNKTGKKLEDGVEFQYKLYPSQTKNKKAKLQKNTLSNGCFNATVKNSDNHKYTLLIGYPKYEDYKNNNLNDGHLSISPKLTPKPQQTPEQHQTPTNDSDLVIVTGKVETDDKTPEALIGATVAIPNTTIGATTAIDGSFSFKSPNNAKLEVRYLGYVTQYIDLANIEAVDKTKDIGTIRLSEDSTNMEEVVIAPFPQQIPAQNNATMAIFYNPDIPDQPTDLSKRDNKRNDKVIILACQKNYILMNGDYEKITGDVTFTYTEKDDEGELVNKTYSNQYDTAQNNLIPPENLSPEATWKYYYTIARQLKDAKTQCVKKADCNTKKTVIKSQYELTDDKKYTCIVKECITGYTTNEAENDCEKVEDCKDSLTDQTGVKVATYRGNDDNRTCVVTECECGYDISADKQSCIKWTNKNKCNKPIRGAEKMERFCSDQTEVCHAISCDNDHELVTVENHNYKLPSGIEELKTCQSHERKCTEEERSRYTEQTGVTWDTNIIKKEKAINFNEDGARICIPTECKCGYDLKDINKYQKCTKWNNNEKCNVKPDNAAEDKYYRDCNKNDKEYCKILECTNGYKVNNDKDKCIGTRGECTPDNDKHVLDAKWKKVNGERKCVITECEKGYEPNKDGSECVGMIVLPEYESASRIGELETLYNTAHDNETSIANKILGTASMAATGAGGMMLASGLTEQKADKEAEEKMRGYVATFKCNYGNTNVEYGTQPTELPTSTELYNLYAEYVTLANDLKLRKDVLGMRAGIESEPILNSATSGLYDDVSSGRSAGMYTSLARAILDPNGADAAAWAEQTKKSKNLIIAGATTAGVGVIGSIVGNVLINKDAPNLQYVREEIDKINKKYKEFYKEFEKIADDLDGTITMKNDADKDEDEDEPEPMGGNDNPAQNGKEPVENNDTTKCPDDAPGTYPDCKCIDKENKAYDPSNNQCKDKVAPLETSDLPSEGVTINTTDADLKTTATDITLSIPGSTLFKLGEHNVIPAAREIIEKLVKALSKLAADTQIKFDNVITVNGYTDPVDEWDLNQTLSENRADAVMNIIVDKVKELNNNYLKQDKTGENTVGNGETGCTCAAGIDIKDNEQVIERRNKYSECSDTTKELSDIKFESSENNDTNTEFPPCRRVEISITLPKISAEALHKYGFTVGDSEISISDFIKNINKSDVASTK